MRPQRQLQRAVILDHLAPVRQRTDHDARPRRGGHADIVQAARDCS
jgi:hypothetical protein